MALNLTPEPKDGPGGQVFAISGLNVVRGESKWVQNDPCNCLLYHFVIKDGSKLDSWARRWPRWQSFGHFRPPYGTRWIKMGARWSMPLFILGLFYEKWLQTRLLGQKMAQMVKFWPFPPPMWYQLDQNGCKMIHVTVYLMVVLWKMAVNLTPGPEDGPDGQVLAISGPHVVLGGSKWMQNDPCNCLF